MLRPNLFSGCERAAPAAGKKSRGAGMKTRRESASQVTNDYSVCSSRQGSAGCVQVFPGPERSSWARSYPEPVTRRLRVTADKRLNEDGAEDAQRP